MTDKVLSPPAHVEPVVFTRDQLDWLPWLEPMAEQDLTARHMAGLVDAARAKSPYFRLLARDPEVLEARTRTDKDIFYNPEAGLPRAFIPGIHKYIALRLLVVSGRAPPKQAGFARGTFTGQSNAGQEDAYLRKFDLSGNTIWTREFGTSSSDEAMGVGLDSSGVYVTGITNGTLPGQTSAGSQDAFARKYDTSGNVTTHGDSCGSWCSSQP
jgi:hypothetical protein